ncbi:MAG: hypothetical protein ABI432_07155 [Flavobacteriales bacterium]
MIRIPRRTAWITLVLCIIIVLLAGVEWYRNGFTRLFDGPGSPVNARSLSSALWAFTAAALGLFMLVALVFGKKVPGEKSENVQPREPDPTRFGPWL